MKKLIEYCLSVLMILGLWLYGRLKTYSFSMSRSVQVLVREPKGHPIQDASLSPDGKNLIYQPFNSPYFMLNLMTGKTRRITKKCGYPTWLDHQTLFCNSKGALLDVRDFSTIALQKVDAQQQSNSRLLEGADKLYELQAERKKPVYLILSGESHVYLFNVEEELKVPSGISVTVIPSRIKRKVNHVSPNGEYYFRHYKDHSLRLFSNQDNRLLREVSFNGNTSCVLGWMYDSSGLIYYTSKGMFDFRSHPIYKLNVPR